MVVTNEPQTEASNGNAAGPPLEPPAPELSPLRVAILLIVIAGIAFGAWKLITNSTSAAAAKSRAVPVYAPYVDVTLTPTYQFQLPSADPVSTAYLGFIVSDPSSSCTPSWGGYYTLSQADQSLQLGARIAQLRTQGGSAAISFGGQANTELAVACSSTSQLTQAYTAAINRYHAKTVDFDIEGAALANAAANTRRAAAVASIQKQMAAHHTQLHVWMTLPVSNQGLTAQGIATVRSMLAAHVKLAGVNAMAMDFGSGQGAAKDMFTTVRSSLYATHAQVQSLWRQAGLSSNAGTAWEHLGVTVMLGVNDVTNEHFTVSDARQLATFANREGIPRVSAWSLNRDSECGAAFPTVGVVSNTCSGVLQSPLEFTKILSRLRGTKIARQQSSNATAQALQGPTTKVDNPKTSPYPVWQPAAAYVAGYKVVWQSDIYQANWWSQGTAPGSTASNSQTAGPWLLIGPVSSNSTGFKPELLAPTNQPAWSPTTVYHQGQRVTFNGLPFEARYYTKGDQPLAQLPGNPSSPWTPLFTAPGEPTDTGIGSGTNR
jgi:chitinase